MVAHLGDVGTLDGLRFRFLDNEIRDIQALTTNLGFYLFAADGLEEDTKCG